MATDAYHALCFLAQLSAFIGFSPISLLFLVRTLAFGVALVPTVWLSQFAWYFSRRDNFAVAQGKLYGRIAYGAGKRQVVDIFRPAKSLDGARRLIIFVSGGGWTVGFRLWGLCIAQELSRRGFAVALVDYRNHPQTDAAGMVADVRQAIFAAIDASGQASLGSHARAGDQNTAAVAAADATSALPLDVTLMGQSAGAHLIMMALMQEIAAGAGGPLTATGTAAKVSRIVAVSGLYDVLGPAFSNQFRRMAGVPRHRALCIFGHAPAAFSPILLAQQLARRLGLGGALPFVRTTTAATEGETETPPSKCPRERAVAIFDSVPALRLPATTATCPGSESPSIWNEHTAHGPLARAAATGPCGCLRAACCVCFHRSSAPVLCCDWCGSSIDSDGLLHQHHDTPGDEAVMPAVLAARRGGFPPLGAAAASGDASGAARLKDSIGAERAGAAPVAPLARDVQAPVASVPAVQVFAPLHLPSIHLFHGTADTTAPPSESIRLCEAIQQLYDAAQRRGGSAATLHIVQPEASVKTARSSAAKVQSSLESSTLAATGAAATSTSDVCTGMPAAPERLSPTISLTMYDGCTHTDPVLEGPAAGNYLLLDDVCALIDGNWSRQRVSSASASIGVARRPVVSASSTVADGACFSASTRRPAVESLGSCDDGDDCSSTDDSRPFFLPEISSGAGAMPLPPSKTILHSNTRICIDAQPLLPPPVRATTKPFWQRQPENGTSSIPSISLSVAAVAVARRINPF